MTAGRRTHSVSLDLPRLLLKYAFDRGIDSRKALQKIGWDEGFPKNLDGWMPFDQFNTLWKKIAQQSGDPHFGLHFGERAPDFSSGHILFVMMTNCATLREALERFCRYHGLMNNVAVPVLHADTLQIVSDEKYPALLEPHYMEAISAMINTTLYRLTGKRVRLKEIHFMHSQPNDTDEYRRIFNIHPLFEQSSNCLVFDEQDLHAPLVLLNPIVLAALDEFAKQLLAQIDAPGSWAQRSADEIGKLMLSGERPRLNAVARTLAVSPRHLQNKLKVEGLTYQAVLDAVRKKLALNYLEQDAMTVCETAFLLGFSEQSAFTHAFKRWTGMAPTEYLAGVQMAKS